MKKLHKRLNLAVTVMRIVHLIIKVIFAAYELYSKVVNYNGPHIRELQLFLRDERKAGICTQ